MVPGQGSGKKELGWMQVAVDKELVVAAVGLRFDSEEQSEEFHKFRG
jgi:hypothetical protein